MQIAVIASKSMIKVMTKTMQKYTLERLSKSLRYWILGYLDHKILLPGARKQTNLSKVVRWPWQPTAPKSNISQMPCGANALPTT